MTKNIRGLLLNTTSSVRLLAALALGAGLAAAPVPMLYDAALADIGSNNGGNNNDGDGIVNSAADELKEPIILADVEADDVDDEADDDADDVDSGGSGNGGNNNDGDGIVNS